MGTSSFLTFKYSKRFFSRVDFFIPVVIFKLHPSPFTLKIQRKKAHRITVGFEFYFGGGGPPTAFSRDIIYQKYLKIK